MTVPQEEILFTALLLKTGGLNRTKNNIFRENLNY